MLRGVQALNATVSRARGAPASFIRYRGCGRLHTLAMSASETGAAAPAAAAHPTLNIHGPGAEQLRNAGCEGACSRDTPKVEPAQLAEYLRALPAWHLSADQTTLTRSFTAKNFVAAINFFNRVKDVAEAEGHHPDLHLRNFREVEVVVSTHAVGGLTMFDLVLAAKLDTIEVDYSPKWLKQQQERMAAAGGGH